MNAIPTEPTDGSAALVPWPVLRAAVERGDWAAVAAVLGEADPDPDLLVLDNPRWTSRHVAAATQPGHLWRELYPRAGLLWGDRITVVARQLHLFRSVPLAALPRPVVIGVRGTASERGELITASGPPGSVARITVLPSSGESIDSVVVFAEDGLLTSLGDSRYELGMFTNFTFTDAAMILDTTWTPGPACYDRFDELRVVVDVPAPTPVRFWLDGTELPVRRRYVALHPELELPPELAADATFWSHVVDLTSALHDRADPDQPWHLRVEMAALQTAEYGGVHLTAVPRRCTQSFTPIELCDSTLLQQMVDASGGGELGPGMTFGKLLVANALQADPPGARYQPNVVFGDGDGTPLVASVYRRADPAERAPAVIFVHGGGWSGGDRGYHYRHMHRLAELGYVTVNIEYRLNPDVDWRASLADVKCAVRWVRQHAAELGADPDRIAVAGGSAGGHLAAMIACTPGRWEGTGGWNEVPSTVAAAVLLYPPVDLPEVLSSWGEVLPRLLADYFGDELLAASPITQVSPECPPILTLCGDADPLIAVGPLRRFHQTLDEAGVANELVVYPGRGHGFDIYAAQWADSAQAMSTFLNRFLGHDPNRRTG